MERTTVPAHINDVTGRFCTHAGELADGGQCPAGCDHAEHYANDGHLECADAWAVIGADAGGVTIEWMGDPDDMPAWIALAADQERDRWSEMGLVYMLVTADEAVEVEA